MTNTTTPKIGQKIDSIEAFIALPVGSTLTDAQGWVHTKVADPVLAEDGSMISEQHTTRYVAPDGSEGTFYAPWSWGVVLTSLPAEESPAAPAPARPLIDFSGPSRATAREYATDLTSRVNNEGTNLVLNEVALGKQVDAYALNEALLDAMRHIATRFGQSMARRRAGEKAAHLGYIVHGVLDNHADNLPAYEAGQRSRKVAALEADLAEAHSERASLVTEVEALKARTSAAQEESVRIRKVATARDSLLAETVADRDQVASVLDYALDLLSEQDKARVFGFWDGVKA